METCTQPMCRNVAVHTSCAGNGVWQRRFYTQQGWTSADWL